ncbi:MAG: hypothetical protein U0L05_01300 [Schaedlerella sp.]|nr:hypothetical protein [Schaedlerella sp.]
MERLTVPAKKLEDGRTVIPIIDGRAVREHAMEIYWRLKEYEDLEEQGLLLKLPCNAGEKVYVITTCKDFGKVLDGTLWDSAGGFGTATGYYCPYELNDSCPFEDDFEECDGGCECFENKFAIFEDYVESIMIYGNENYVFMVNCGSASFRTLAKQYS